MIACIGSSIQVIMNGEIPISIKRYQMHQPTWQSKHGSVWNACYANTSQQKPSESWVFFFSGLTNPTSYHNLISRTYRLTSFNTLYFGNAPSLNEYVHSHGFPTPIEFDTRCIMHRVFCAVEKGVFPLVEDTVSPAL